jgi:Uma2 family endonuclease
MINRFSDLDLNGTYSYADYLQWQFEETVELIKGKILGMSPAPKRLHQKASTKIFKPLTDFFIQNPCELYFAPFDVRFPKHPNDPENKVFTVLQPDICVVCDLEKLDDNGCNGAPDLIVEITSKGTRQRDFHFKYSVYEESGVFEYWIVDPLEKVIYQNHLVDGAYKQVAIVGEGETLYSAHFTGLEVKVSDIFG